MARKKTLKGALVTTIIFVGLPLSSYSGVVLSMNRCGVNMQKTIERIQIGNVLKTEIDKRKIVAKKTGSKVIL